jgi:cytochrome c oxidase assembly protein subunit 15
MTALRALRWTAGVAVALTFVLIVLGAVVRATNSGLACPDWPTCYGRWLPLPGDVAALPDVGYTYGQIMLEWVHRLLAGVILGPVALAIAILAWRQRGRDPRLPWVGGVLVLILLVQAGLGGVTVLDSNSPWSVAVHLGTALLLLTVLLLVVERASPAAPAWPVPPRVARAAALAWLLVWLTMLSAAMVAKSGAALACATWPDCHGLFLPDLSDPSIRLNVAHRALAAASAAGLLLLCLVARRPEVPHPLEPWAGTALLLLGVEVLLGAGVVWSEVEPLVAILHQALGVVVFIVVTAVLWRSLKAAARDSWELRHGLGLRGA